MKRVIAIALISTIMSASGARSFVPDPYFDLENSQCVDGVFETNSQWDKNVIAAGKTPSTQFTIDLGKCERETRDKRNAEMNRAYGLRALFSSLGNAFHGNNVPTENMYQVNY